MGIFSRVKKMIGLGQKTYQEPSRSHTLRGKPSTDEKVRDRLSGLSRITFLPYYNESRNSPSEAVRQEMRKMMNEPFVKSAWAGNILTVVSQDFQVHPRDKKNKDHKIQADFIRDCIEAADGGMVELAASLLNPIGPDGYSVSEKVFEHIGDGKHQGKIGLRALKPKHPDRVYLVGDEYQNITGVKDRLSSETYPISDFVYKRYLPMWDEPEGMAPFRAAYGAYWMIDTVKKLRIIHHERKIGGMLVGTYTDEADQQPLEESLANAKSSTWMTVPEGVRIQAMQIATASETEFKSIIEDLRSDMVTGITFASLQILQGSVPDARGDSKVQKGISDLAPWYLTYLLQECFNRQVVPDLIDYNYMHDGSGYPRISFGAVSNAELVQIADLLGRAQQLGFKPSRKHYGEVLSIQEADPSDPSDVLASGGQQPPMGGGGPGGGGLGALLGGIGGGGGGPPGGGAMGQPTGNPFAAPPSDAAGDPASQGGQPMGLFSERGNCRVDKFAWHDGERGGRYFLPDGKQDTPENRLYGSDGRRAEAREKQGPSAPDVRDAVNNTWQEGKPVKSRLLNDERDVAVHTVDIGDGRNIFLKDRRDGFLEIEFDKRGSDGRINLQKSEAELQSGTMDFLRGMQGLVAEFAKAKLPIAYAPADRRRQKLYERVMVQNGYVPVNTRDDDVDSHMIFWQHGSQVPANRHADLMARYRQSVAAMNIEDRMAEEFAEKDWQSIGNGLMRSPGGRVVSEQTFRTWFQDDSGFDQDHRSGQLRQRLDQRDPGTGEAVASEPVARKALARRLIESSDDPQFHSDAGEVVNAMPARAAMLAARSINQVHIVDTAEKMKQLSEHLSTLPRMGQKIVATADYFGYFTSMGELVVRRSQPFRTQDNVDWDDRETMAHEMAHAVDIGQQGVRFSATPQWQSVFAQEFREPRLTKYATTAPVEAFAEFARTAWLGDDDDRAKLSQIFPQATQFFQAAGLWPVSQPKPTRSLFRRLMDNFAEENGGQLVPDIFGQRIPTGRGDSHIDIGINKNRIDAFGWEDWQAEGEMMVSPGGRKLTRATYEKLSQAGKASAPTPISASSAASPRPAPATVSDPVATNLAKQLASMPSDTLTKIVETLASAIENEQMRRTAPFVPQVGGPSNEVVRREVASASTLPIGPMQPMPSVYDPNFTASKTKSTTDSTFQVPPGGKLYTLNFPSDGRGGVIEETVVPKPASTPAAPQQPTPTTAKQMADKLKAMLGKTPTKNSPILTSTTVSDFRAVRPQIESMSRAEVEELSQHLGYTPAGSKKATIDNLMGNIEGLHMSNVRAASILSPDMTVRVATTELGATRKVDEIGEEIRAAMTKEIAIPQKELLVQKIRDSKLSRTQLQDLAQKIAGKKPKSSADAILAIRAALYA